MPFERHANRLLLDWYGSPRRKPLVLRGARQAGKTTAVRGLAAHAPLYLELNLERTRDRALIRTCSSAEELLNRLRQRDDLPSLPKNSLLFLDEIQEHPEALGWLRFFHEDHPELAVIGAGSLLEVRLHDTALPYPVGRVEFLRLEPLTFLEFLEATGNTIMAADLRRGSAELDGIEPGLHALATHRFHEFLQVGGLPEAVEVWRTEQDPVAVGRIHQALDQAYRQDLLKYRDRGTPRYPEIALENAPDHYGARFKYERFAPGEPGRPIKEALRQLTEAMVIEQALPTSSTTLPLVPRRRSGPKLIPLDIGLALAQMNVTAARLQSQPIDDLLDGRIAEAFVGTQLLSADPRAKRSLRFWVREGGSSNAEIDFIVATSGKAVPVEVKAGASGSLKSMHEFLFRSDGDEGVRLSSAAGGVTENEVALSGGRKLAYTLRSLPLYLAELVS